MAPDDPYFPQPQIDFEGLLNFSELDWFVTNWEELGLPDEDLLLLQMRLMASPKRGSVVPGTGGLRKLRFSPPAWNRGKSGALRVCYVYFEKYGFIVLVTVYAKNEMDNLSSAGIKSIQAAIERIEAALQRRFGF
jgi:hypothetical protein